MAEYYLNRNTQTTGEHEVHKASCFRMPEPQNRMYLGSFLDAKEAVREARRYFVNVDGCYYCANEAHNK